ncbi:MAG: 6-phosphogluconolactonase [Armatimonadetes bacterium CP1_7O]|nr:MAG: 6-phosphogluconolactonase [Armatimonadetes bacterium CP1_7O]RMH07335.1 MAG: 6-phosphogluconolactonase [Armatimonadota bacterium]
METQRAENADEQFQQLLQMLEEAPDLRVVLRLIIRHGQRHPRGTILPLDWQLVADALVELLEARLTQQPTCSLALSGGKTPETLYLLLATRHYQSRLDWSRVHLFWGDERYVPHEDPRSNYFLAYTAWLSKAPIPRENIHPMPTHYPNPEDAARAYEAELHAYFGAEAPVPVFDLVLLGMGDDGHIASLFPGDPALEETTRWVVPSRAPVAPHQRLTLTLPVLNAAPRVWFLVAGDAKRAAIEQLFSETECALPAARISPSVERFWWLSDSLYAVVKSLNDKASRGVQRRE